MIQDDPDPPKLQAKPDWPWMMESIKEWLRSYLGFMKIPLAYVVGLEEEV